MSSSAVSDLDPDLERIAQNLVDALESSDPDLWGAQFSSNGVTWHSHSREEMSAKDNVEVLRGMFHAVVEELRYADVRRHRIDGGYVQQHTLSLKARNGAVFLTGVCMVIHVTDGRVTRLEEYLDSSVLAFGQANAISQ